MTDPESERVAFVVEEWFAASDAFHRVIAVYSRSERAEERVRSLNKAQPQPLDPRREYIVSKAPLDP